MNETKAIKVGVGFATGRKSFRKVLNTYIHSWKESGLVENQKVSINLFVAYDLSYHKTEISDYTRIRSEMAEQIDSRMFIGVDDVEREIERLVCESILTHEEARMIFGKGYASKRNEVLYFALKNRMDYLVFLDDDEYPIAVTNTKESTIWSGQHVLLSHLKNIKQADMTHGHHCGYISPIPYMKYDDTLTESDFRSFIEAISNDILNWDNIKTVMENGGVTYADTSVLTTDEVFEVEESNHCKFISGANLCINLTDPRRIFPFYNPPGARGEDTFLSTCLSERKVLRVPCYAFHDGFSTYNHLLEGVLPIHLKFIQADSEKIINRFYKACIGWIRYKPLLMYITQPEHYEENIKKMRQQLNEAIPKICTYFNQPDFNKIIPELEKYNRNVKKNYAEFIETQRIWAKIMEYFVQDRVINQRHQDLCDIPTEAL